MAMVTPAPIEGLARHTERAFPHIDSLVRFAAGVNISLPNPRNAGATRLAFARGMLAGSQDAVFDRFGQLFLRRSLFAEDWLASAESAMQMPLQLSDFQRFILPGLDNLLETVSSRLEQAFGASVDSSLLAEICSFRSDWMSKRLLMTPGGTQQGGRKWQSDQFRRVLFRLQQLFLHDIVQAHSVHEDRSTDRLFAEQPSYYCSFSRTRIWLDERPGPVGRAELAEMSANLSRLNAPVYRLLWVTPDELVSGAARRAAFFVWILGLEAVCNDKAITDVRWRLVDWRNPEPRPFAILRDDTGQRRLGARRGLMSTGLQEGRSCPHLATTFQVAAPIQDLLQRPFEARPVAA